MQLKIDTSEMTFVAGGPPQPVMDFETRQPRADREGQPLYSIPVVVLSVDGAEVITVKTAGEPRGVVQQTPLRITGLVGAYWAMADDRNKGSMRSGIAWRAERIEAVTPARSGSAPAAS